MVATEDVEPVATNNNLSLLLGDSARTRILYVLLFFHDQHMEKKELAYHANIARPTVYQHLPTLRRLGLITEDEDSRVTLNKENDLAKSLGRVEWEFLDVLVDVEAAGGDIHEFLEDLGAEYS